MKDKIQYKLVKVTWADKTDEKVLEHYYQVAARALVETLKNKGIL